ncbi:class I SAM-dependent methyltransferase [Cyanobacterium aponinum UTEX 3222]|uniref:class I SAM-dependent methyltransferase n=1 Tax=Cyanobacterium aponinum TaxID=379064 RepID=UPI002B4BD5E0|nr:class I SAM-dependent methyltransferase [Cyanobacterium aponinum]WRL36809.1 class I SAM-dependent methyltransferase [Cyanobacterium aponinum UTEX 3221]WRL43136.1 class I SAM-dependent methyltransferase [Cyanobacterium aponinum UTEX 3222]
MSSEAKKQTINDLVEKHLSNNQPSAWFEELYASAKSNPYYIPWAKLEANSHLREWLKNHQGIKKNEQLTAVVIGCGLGDDAELLQETGFQVTAFDVSPTAINWCRQRFPNTKVNYVCEDIFQLPRIWEKQFDFVWECRTIQALPLEVRENAINAVVSLVKVIGTLLMFTHYHTEKKPPSGPPWALSENDLDYFIRLGLKENKRSIDFLHEGKTNTLLLEFDTHTIKSKIVMGDSCFFQIAS